MIHAGTYGATLHYLKAVAAAGTTDATKVVAKMKELPIDDFYTKGTVREDGRVMRPYYLLQVKKPSESKYPVRLSQAPCHGAGRASGAAAQRERLPDGEATLRSVGEFRRRFCADGQGVAREQYRGGNGLKRTVHGGSRRKTQAPFGLSFRRMGS